MKWRLYELHNKAMAPDLGANVFSFFLKKKFMILFHLFKKKKKKEK